MVQIWAVPLLGRTPGPGEARAVWDVGLARVGRVSPAPVLQ